MVSVPNQNVKNDDGCNDATLYPRGDTERYSHSHDKNKHHGVCNLLEQDLAGVHAWPIVELILAVLLKALLGVGIRKTINATAAELLRDLFKGEAVSGLGHGAICLPGDVPLEGVWLAHADRTVPSSLIQDALMREIPMDIWASKAVRITQESRLSRCP